jgi:hypothetical protein
MSASKSVKTQHQLNILKDLRRKFMSLHLISTQQIERCSISLQRFNIPALLRRPRCSINLVGHYDAVCYGDAGPRRVA